jgi:hypothetical protein
VASTFKLNGIITFQYHMDSNNKNARLAGLLYLVIVFFGVFYLRYAPSQLIVPGNMPATIGKIRVSETLFRLSILAELIGGIVFLLLPMVLYRLFKGVNRTMATLMVIFASLSIIISYANLFNRFAVLTLIGNADYLKTFSAAEIQTQISLHLDFYDNGMLMQELFWGLWLFPFGYLVFSSGFLPKALGILLMAGCIGYVIDFTGSFISPHYNDLNITRYITLPASIGELGSGLWMLIMGARERMSA